MRCFVPLAATILLLLLPQAATANEFPQPEPRQNSYIVADRWFVGGFHVTKDEIAEVIDTQGEDCEGDLCLKDYEDEETGETAAHIVHDISQELALNPYVILVALQKENSLLTDEDPEEWQYRTAMGYGCPDGADCEEDFFGFRNQIELGATLLRVGFDRSCGDRLSQMNWRVNSRWRAGNVTEVDTVPTHIGNCATGSLYNYTPHRVDSAWIPHDGELYYGNYNFAFLFHDWYPYTEPIE